LVIKLAWKFDLVDDPQKNRQPKTIHTYPVPRGGGLAIFVGIMVSAFLFLPTDKHLIAIMSGAFFILLLGLLDDKFNLNPYLRIVSQLLILTIPVVSGVSINFITNPKGGIINLSGPQMIINLGGNYFQIHILGSLITIFWIFAVMNMVNMGAKGIDGQLPGVIIIAALTIATLSLKFSADITQWPVIILALITAGAYLGFLPWNFYPQKIMPSYSGSTLGGYLLAILAILSTTKVGTLIVVLGIPIIDTIYVVIRRISQGRSPVWGDRGHLHHRLLDYGLSKRQVAIFYWITSAILGILALNLNSSSKIYTIIGIAIFVGGLILWTKNYQKKKL
jgi:UDP-GlcNAc:undecaprenyl-phosphate GlcNAc-1-phosphate transferase